MNGRLETMVKRITLAWCFLAAFQVLVCQSGATELSCCVDVHSSESSHSDDHFPSPEVPDHCICNCHAGIMMLIECQSPRIDMPVADITFPCLSVLLPDAPIKSIERPPQLS